MELQFKLLADHMHHAPLIVDWWLSYWGNQLGSPREDMIDDLMVDLGNSLVDEELPLHVFAVLDGAPVASAALKMHELEELYPQCEYWLGSVFVAQGYRGRGIAARLCDEMVRLGQGRGLPHLYLQTEDLSGGLYRQLGWSPVENFINAQGEGLLMKREL